MNTDVKAAVGEFISTVVNIYKTLAPEDAKRADDWSWLASFPNVEGSKDAALALYNLFVELVDFPPSEATTGGSCSSVTVDAPE